MLKQNTILLILSVFLFSCATNKMVDSDMKDKQLVNDKENPIFYTYFPGLPIGVAVNTWEYFDESNKYNKLMKQFNGFVYENSMKMDAMQPTEGNFEFGNAKKLIKYAKDNNSVVRGHTLLWHNQYPNWFFKDIDGKDVSKDVLLKRIERHIKTIVTELKGEVKYWDVVNEVLEENGTLRNSKYLEIVGSEEYITKAFQWAHESDPNAKLFINDYSICFSGAKQDGMYNLVKKLLAKGVPIHGVGLQSHINMSHPNVEDMRKTIKRFASLGLEVQVTELDISVYRSSSEKKMDITTDILLEQAERYRSLFEMFKEEAQNGNLTMVTLWGLSDDKTWLNDFPVKGRGNAPLLFDGNLEPKPAYWAIVDPSKLPESSTPKDETPKTYPTTSSNSGTIDVDGVVDTKWNDETATLLGIETEGKSSSGTSFKTLWDNKYLYVLVDVVDKELNNASENPWEQDSIEIFIDQNNEKSTSYQQDDAQYRVSYTNFVTFNGGDQDGFKSAVSLTEQGYMVEVAVPISYIEMKPGQVIGFDVQINNADSSGSRVGVRNWANSTNLGYQDTSDFGLLKFD